MTTLQSPEIGVQRPSPHDVLLGRGGLANHHEGNRSFRSLVSLRQPEYLLAPKKDKSKIAQSIIDDIQTNGGKFLQRDPISHNLWVPVSLAKATEKTRQALREGIDIRDAIARGVTSQHARHAVEIAKRKHCELKTLRKSLKKRHVVDDKKILSQCRKLPVDEVFSLLNNIRSEVQSNSGWNQRQEHMQTLFATYDQTSSNDNLFGKKSITDDSLELSQVIKNHEP